MSKILADVHGREVTSNKFGDKFTFSHDSNPDKAEFIEFMLSLTKELANCHDYVDVRIKRGINYDLIIDSNCISEISFRTGVIG